MYMVLKKKKVTLNNLPESIFMDLTHVTLGRKIRCQQEIFDL